MPGRFFRRLAVNEWDTDPPALVEAVAALSTGAIVAYPTETYYGLAVDPRDPMAVESLFAAKGRDHGRSIPLIAASLEQLSAVAGSNLPAAMLRLATRFWPGPLTVVIPAWPGLASDIHGGTRTVAVRVPGHPVARALPRAFGYPVTSTSANRSGAAPLSTADEVATALDAAIAVLLDGGPTPGGAPSTIVDLTTPEPRLLRDGAVPWPIVQDCLAGERAR